MNKCPSCRQEYTVEAGVQVCACYSESLKHQGVKDARHRYFQPQSMREEYVVGWNNSLLNQTTEIERRYIS